MVFYAVFTLQALFAYSATLNLIPETGPTPFRMISASALYYPLKHQILIFGGAQNSKIMSSLYFFNIQSSTWGEYFPESDFVPPGLHSSLIFLGKDQKFYVLFGKTMDPVSSNFFSFNFDNLSWQSEKLTGDSMQPSFESASCELIFNDQSYLAVFGGITSGLPSKELYLINTETLVVRKMPDNGHSPGRSFGNSLCYAEGQLYLFGALLDDYESNNIFFKYDLVTESWEKIAVSSSTRGLKFSYCLVLNNTFYSFFGYNTENSYSIQQYSIDTQNWINYSNPYFYMNAAYVFTEPTLYVLFGLTTESYENSILTYKIWNDKIEPKMLLKSSDYPPKRKNHATFVLDNKIYVYGGKAEDNTYLSDMWEFDIDEKTWSRIQTSGQHPENREKMAYSISSNGNGVYVYGGRDDSEIFADLYFYNVRLKIWDEITTKAIDENARYDSCMHSVNYKLVILGGSDSSNIHDNILIYDLFHKSMTIFDPQIPNLINFECVFRDLADQGIVEIYILGGSSPENIPNIETFIITLHGIYDGAYSMSTKKILEALALTSESTALLDNDKIYIIGGSYHEYQISKEIFIINLEGELNYFKLKKNIGFFGHRAVQLGNKFYVLGGCSSDNYNKIFYLGTNSMYEIVFEDEEYVKLNCLNGNFENNECIPCNFGYYFENGECKACPLGTYLNLKGALSLSMCIPYPFDTFNDILAASSCKTVQLVLIALLVHLTLKTQY